MVQVHRLPTRAELEAVSLSGSYIAFVRQAWHLVEASNDLVENWHIEEICEILEDVARDRASDIRRDVVLAVPPASTKTKLVSILWQPWVWTWWPESRWITATYESKLALRHSREARNLVQDEWYQSRWPIKLTKDAEGEWVNERGGFRVAVGTGGAITGSHSHFQVLDDLVKEQDARLGTPQAIGRTMENARGFVWTTMATRKVDNTLARVLVGQRIHKRDPQQKAIDEGWESVIFPARFNVDRADPRDHRTEDGEPLCPARMDGAAIDELARQLGPTAAVAQLAQHPTDPGGTLIKLELAFRRRYDRLPVELEQSLRLGRPASRDQVWLTAWDFPFKGKETSSWVVGQLWCRWESSFYLVDQVRGQWGFEAAKAQVKAFIRRYPVARKHLFEDAANAPALEDNLKKEIPGLILDPVAGGVLARTQAVEGTWHSGAVVTPASAEWMNGPDGFLVEHIDYSGSDADVNDQVSASSTALLHLTSAGVSSWAAKMRAARKARQ